MLNTLVHNMSIHKGSQWAILNGTHVLAYEHKGDSCTETSSTLPSALSHRSNLTVQKPAPML